MTMSNLDVFRALGSVVPSLKIFLSEAIPKSDAQQKQLIDQS
jgi:hypothetical protein